MMVEVASHPTPSTAAATSPSLSPSESVGSGSPIGCHSPIQTWNGCHPEHSNVYLKTLVPSTAVVPAAVVSNGVITTAVVPNGVIQGPVVATPEVMGGLEMWNGEAPVASPQFEVRGGYGEAACYCPPPQYAPANPDEFGPGVGVYSEQVPSSYHQSGYHNSPSYSRGGGRRVGYNVGGVNSHWRRPNGGSGPWVSNQWRRVGTYPATDGEQSREGPPPAVESLDYSCVPDEEKCGDEEENCRCGGGGGGAADSQQYRRQHEGYNRSFESHGSYTNYRGRGRYNRYSANNRRGGNGAWTPRFEEGSSRSYPTLPESSGRGNYRGGPRDGCGHIPFEEKSNKMQFFKTKMCPWFERGRCDRGADCGYAHSREEIQPMPDLSNTRMCNEMIRTGHCSNLGNCRFAHSVQELRATGVYYKTRFCLFFRRGHCAAGVNCRHAHDINEVRAAPPTDSSAGSIADFNEVAEDEIDGYECSLQTTNIHGGGGVLHDPQNRATTHHKGWSQSGEEKDEVAEAAQAGVLRTCKSSAAICNRREDEDEFAFLRHSKSKGAAKPLGQSQSVLAARRGGDDCRVGDIGESGAEGHKSSRSSAGSTRSATTNADTEAESQIATATEDAVSLRHSSSNVTQTPPDRHSGELSQISDSPRPAVLFAAPDSQTPILTTVVSPYLNQGIVPAMHGMMYPVGAYQQITLPPDNPVVSGELDVCKSPYPAKCGASPYYGGSMDSTAVWSPQTGSTDGQQGFYPGSVEYLGSPMRVGSVALVGVSMEDLTAAMPESYEE